MQLAAGPGQPLDGGDAGAVGLHGEDGAALDAVLRTVGAAHENGAGSTVARVAADDRANLAELFTEMMNEEGPGLDVVDVARAVDVDTDPDTVRRGHKASRGDVRNGPSRGGRPRATS
ncbi:hypothetical protein GCM10007977_013470 [Dactylosporangium sucinum]|uniref:Uncharacterized protein n=1 Tax=Dactylosporangium sucinum TaxID=1424081 RepID=A0A917WLH1_9ACTN|nr:hypothetical protein GCM10007977_013470 [Dactylosporangium sucinum]